ncbi:MAG: 50S ribosomal protein L18 [Vampirovibrionales bacterium]|nr:50S ribosomal protein L18 [Vampirovibrionales bacterium]
MISKPNRKAIVRKRHQRIRRKLAGTQQSPRLAVHRSGKHIYAQLIDDSTASTIAAASTLDKDLREGLKSGANIDAARRVGELVAQRALKAGVNDVVFDRGGYLYHGRVAALAEAAREAGLNF